SASPMGLNASFASSPIITTNVRMTQTCRPRLISSGPALCSAASSAANARAGLSARMAMIAFFTWYLLVGGDEQERNQQGVQHLRFHQREADEHQSLHERQGFGLAGGRFN